jgi:hypothetical protein
MNITIYFRIVRKIQCEHIVFNSFVKTSLITSDISSLLQKCIQTLKSVNLGYPPFNFLFFIFNFNSPLEFSVKSYQNFLLKIFIDSGTGVFTNSVKF